MDKNIYDGISLIRGTDNRCGPWIATVVLSVVCHILLAVAMFRLPDLMPRRNMILPSAITVNMISLPIPGDLPDLGVPEADTVPAEEPEVPVVTAEDSEVQTNAPAEVVAEPEEIPVADESDPPVAEESAPETPPVAETTVARDQVVIEDAPEKAPPKETPPPKTESPAEEAPVQKVVKAKKPSPQAKKPDKIKEKVLKPEAVRKDRISKAVEDIRRKQDRKIARRETRGGSPFGRPGGTGRGGASGAIGDVYKAQVRHKIEQNWVFSEQLARIQKDLRTVVVVRILSDGSIGDVWFERRSGDSYLDDSAYRAVVKAEPLPPLPDGYPNYTVALNFTPSGLR